MERSNQAAVRWSSAVVAFLVVTSFVSVHASATSGDQRPITPALYVFGDSISDPGNNNYLQTAAKANFKPYGVDFRDGPTGRFTNGKLAIDFLAEKLRLPSPPPYMKLLKEGKLANTTTGVSYASSGCGILEQTGSNLGKCLSLREQIKCFYSTKFKISSAFKSNEELQHHLAKSVFIVNIGSNDYINNYLQDYFNTSALYTPDQFASILHAKLYSAIRRLYDAGARKFVVHNIGLIGCTPAMRATRGGGCVKPVNKIVLLFNQRFPLTVQNLISHLGDVTIVHQRHNPLNSRTASKYGFKDVSRPCCPCCISSGKDAKCNTQHCSNRDEHAYWDLFHTTEKINSIMANLCFDKGKSDCDSYTVKQYSIKELAAL